MRSGTPALAAQLYSLAVLCVLATHLFFGDQQTSLGACFPLPSLASLRLPTACSLLAALTRNNSWLATPHALLQRQQQPASSSFHCGKKSTIRSSAALPFTSPTFSFWPLVYFSCTPTCTVSSPAETNSVALRLLFCTPVGARFCYPSASLSPRASYAFLLRRLCFGVFPRERHQGTLSRVGCSLSAFSAARRRSILRPFSVHPSVTSCGSLLFASVAPTSSLLPLAGSASCASAAFFSFPAAAHGAPYYAASTFGLRPAASPSSTRPATACAANNAASAACFGSSGWCTYPAWLQGVWQVRLRCWWLEDAAEESEAEERENEDAGGRRSFSFVSRTENKVNGSSSSFISRLIRREREDDEEKKQSFSFSPVSSVNEETSNESVFPDTSGTPLDPAEDLPLLLRVFSNIDRRDTVRDSVPGEVFNRTLFPSNSTSFLTNSTYDHQGKRSDDFHNSNWTSNTTRQSLASRSYCCSTPVADDVLNQGADSRACNPSALSAVEHWRRCYSSKNIPSSARHLLQTWRLPAVADSHLLTPLQQHTVAHLQQIIGTYHLHLEPGGVLRFSVGVRRRPRQQYAAAATAAAAADPLAAAAPLSVIRERARTDPCDSHAAVAAAEDVHSCEQKKRVAQVQQTRKQQQQQQSKQPEMERAREIMQAECEVQLPHTSQQQAQRQCHEHYQDVSPMAVEHLQEQLQRLQQQKRVPTERLQEQQSGGQPQVHSEQQTLFRSLQESHHLQPSPQLWQLLGGPVTQSQGPAGCKAYRNSCSGPTEQPPAGTLVLEPPLHVKSDVQSGSDAERHHREMCIPLSWCFTPASRRLVLLFWLPVSMLLLRLSSEIRWRGPAACAYEKGAVLLPATPLSVRLSHHLKAAARAAVPTALPVAIPAAAPASAPAAPAAAAVAATPAASPAAHCAVAPATAPAPVSAAPIGPAASLAASCGAPVEAVETAPFVAAGCEGSTTAGKQCQIKRAVASSSLTAASCLTVRLQPCTTTVQCEADSLPSPAAGVAAPERSNRWRRIPNGVWGRGFLYSCEPEWNDNNRNSSSSSSNVERNWLLCSPLQQKGGNEQGEQVPAPRQQQQQQRYREPVEDWPKQIRHVEPVWETAEGEEAQRRVEEQGSMQQEPVFVPDEVQQQGGRSRSLLLSTLQQMQRSQQLQMVSETKSLRVPVTFPRIKQSGGTALLGEVYVHLKRPNRRTVITRPTSPPLLPKRGFLVLKSGQQRHLFVQELRALQQIQLQYLRHWFFPPAEQSLQRGEVEQQEHQQQQTHLGRPQQAREEDEEEKEERHHYLVRPPGQQDFEQHAQRTEEKQQQQQGQQQQEQQRQQQEQQQQGQQQQKQPQQEQQQQQDQQQAEHTMQTHEGQQQRENEEQEDAAQREVQQGEKTRRQQDRLGEIKGRVLVVHRRQPLAAKERSSLAAGKYLIRCVHELFRRRERDWFDGGGSQIRQRRREKTKDRTSEKSNRRSLRSGKEVDARERRVLVVTVALNGKVVGWTLPPPLLPAAAIDGFPFAVASSATARGPVAAALPPLLSFEDEEVVAAARREKEELEGTAVTRADDYPALEERQRRTDTAKIKTVNYSSRFEGIQREARMITAGAEGRGKLDEGDQVITRGKPEEPALAPAAQKETNIPAPAVAGQQTDETSSSVTAGKRKCTPRTAAATGAETVRKTESAANQDEAHGRLNLFPATVAAAGEAGGEPRSTATMTGDTGRPLRVTKGKREEGEAATRRCMIEGRYNREEVSAAAREEGTKSVAGDSQPILLPAVPTAQHFGMREHHMSTDEQRMQKQIQQDVAAALLHPAVQRKLGFRSVHLEHAVYVHGNRLVNFILQSTLLPEASVEVPRLASSVLDVPSENSGVTRCS